MAPQKCYLQADFRLPLAVITLTPKHERSPFLFHIYTMTLNCCTFKPPALFSLCAEGWRGFPGDTLKLFTSYDVYRLSAAVNLSVWVKQIHERVAAGQNTLTCTHEWMHGTHVVAGQPWESRQENLDLCTQSLPLKFELIHRLKQI